MTSHVLRLAAVLAGGLLIAGVHPVRAQAAGDATAPRAVMLWPDGVPGALGTSERDQPRFYPFLPVTRSTTAAVLIIPGGSYSGVALDLEGFQYARWLNAQGMAAFVLDYRVAPYRYPAEIEDGMQAMRLIRQHASMYGVDPERIGVWGSSAGGHLASTLGTHCGAGAPALPGLSSDGCEANFMILTYPVISMNPAIAHMGSRRNLLGPDPASGLAQALSNELAVTARTPPTFLMATSGDPTVPIANSLEFYAALVKAQVPAEMHLYDYARHGTGLAGTTMPYLSSWTGLLRNWLIRVAMLPATAPPMPPAEANAPAWPQGFTGPGQPRSVASQ